MRRRNVCLYVLLLGVLTGCPRDHMPGGHFDRAADKDVREWLEDHDCTEKDYKKYCLNKEESQECIEKCGL